MGKSSDYLCAYFILTVHAGCSFLGVRMAVGIESRTMPASTQGIKSRDRVREKGEVFTELREINNILDLTADAHRNYKNQRILEPACGNGNFLVVILQRRLNDIAKTFKKSEIEFAILTALSTIYGVDIMPDNIVEARDRLWHEAKNTYETLVARAKRHEEWYLAVEKILETNIQLGDMLNGKDKVEFTEWTSPKTGFFVRNMYRLLDMELGINESIERTPMTHYLKLAEVAHA